MASLYIQTAFLGDLCLAVPALKKLRELDSEKKVDLICRQGLGEFFLRLGIVDRVFEVKKGNWKSYAEIQSQLQGLTYEILCCPHQSLRTAWLVKGLKAKVKLAYHQWWNRPFFTLRREREDQLPDALRQLSLLALVDSRLAEQLRSYQLETGSIALKPVPAWASPVVLSSALPREKLVLIFPGSTWQTKKWKAKGFAQVARWLLEKGYQVHFMGSPEELSLCEQIAQESPGALVQAGKLSLYESLQAASRATLVLCNDSGAQHLASLVDTPTVSIFGPTVLSQGFQAWNNRARVAELEGLACRPCGRHGHQKCPLGTHDCMVKLSPELVQEKIQQLIQESLSPQSRTF